MKKRIITLLLALTFCFGWVVSCGKKESESNGESNSESSSESVSESVSESFKESIKDIVDTEKHLVSDEKRLHRVSVKQSNRKFVVNGTTEYKIVVDKNDNTALKAANFLQSQIGSATSAYPELITNVDSVKWTKTSKYIVLAVDSVEEQAKVTWASDITSEDLGYSGYMIKTVGDSVFIKVNSAYGYQTAVISFLREVLGYEWFGEDVITFENNGETLPDLDIVEKPDFDLTYSSSSWTSSSKYASGLSDTKVFVSTGGIDFHNSYMILSYRKYNDKVNYPSYYHPKWYSDKTGNYHNIFGDSATENQPGQLCYTAHGDYEEYQAMLDTACEAMLGYIREQPQASTITFTQQDTQAVCECDTCTACKEYFGSISSTLLMFVNDLEDKIRTALEAEALANGTEPRKITVLFFAYQKTVNAPVSGELGKNNYKVPSYNKSEGIVNANGVKVLLPFNKSYPDGLKTNDNVGVFYAAISARFNKTFYEDSVSNRSARQELEKWGLLTNKLYIWTYDTNFKHYFMPYNSYDNIVETARCLKDNNCEFYFAQTQDWQNGAHPCFGALKRYIVASVRFDVNMNYSAAVDRFFNAYFGDAAKPMREYYDKLTNYLEYLEIAYPSAFTGSIYDDFIESTVYWSISLMEEYLELCDEAYKAIEKHRFTNPSLYEVLEKNITIETLFPRFMICEYYEGTYTNSEMQAKRQSFYEDCQRLKVLKYSENAYLSDWFNKWGVA